ncbi:MAG TPA: hypothetical protein VIX14_13865 [Terriglobales bacterium]
MELFLNLCWISLLLPAWLLWQRRNGTGSPAKSPAVCPLVFVCALGGVLILLFPVISATDDLHAMRAEMEESSPGKRSVCQSTVEKASGWQSRCQNLPAVISTATSIGLTSIGRLESFTRPLSPPVVSSILHASRAPPCSLLA